MDFSQNGFEFKIGLSQNGLENSKTWLETKLELFLIESRMWFLFRPFWLQIVTIFDDDCQSAAS